MSETGPRVVPCWSSIGIWGREEPRCPELPRVVHCRNCEVFVEGARALLDREPPAGYGTDWATAARAAWAEEQRDAERVVVFRLGEEYFALGVPWVIEVVDWRLIRPVPRCRDDVLLGIANVAGELRLCVSLEVLFGQRPPDVAAPRPAGRLLIVGSEGPDWAIAVDQALSIHWLPEGNLEPSPATVSRSAQAFLRGMFPWRDRRVGLLDGELVLGAIARRLA